MKRLESIDDIVDVYFVSSSPVRSKIFVALGSLFVVFAVIAVSYTHLTLPTKA